MCVNESACVIFTCVCAYIYIIMINIKIHVILFYLLYLQDIVQHSHPICIISNTPPQVGAYRSHASSLLDMWLIHDFSKI